MTAHIHRPDDQGLCACGFDASPGPYVVEVIAQVPPQVPDALTMYCAARRFDSKVFLAAIASRDAALLAPLREEVERLKRERDAEARMVSILRTTCDAHIAEIDAAAADIARLREALRPFAEIAKGFNGDPSHDRDVFLSAVRPTAADWFAAARALAEGQP